MYREYMMMASFFLNAKIQRSGAMPSDAEISQAFDYAERFTKVAAAREEKWEKMDVEFREARRKAQEEAEKRRGT